MTTRTYLNVLKPETFNNGDEERTNFVKIGVAFPHQTGEGFNLKIMDGVSVGGDLVVMPPRVKSEASAESQA